MESPKSVCIQYCKPLLQSIDHVWPSFWAIRLIFPRATPFKCSILQSVTLHGIWRRGLPAQNMDLWPKRKVAYKSTASRLCVKSAVHDGRSDIREFSRSVYQ